MKLILLILTCGKLFSFGECLLSLGWFGSLRRGELLLTDGWCGGRATGCRPEERWIKTAISMATQTQDKIQCCRRHKVELYIYICVPVSFTAGTLASRFDSVADSVREHFVPLIFFRTQNLKTERQDEVL